MQGEKLYLGWSGTWRDLHALTADGHAGLLPARDDDIVDEARQWRNAADEEGGDSPPIATPSGGVAVDAMEIVHIGNRYLPTSYDIVTIVGDKRVSDRRYESWGHVGNANVLEDENSRHGTQKYGVPAKEGEELRSGCEDFPLRL